MKHSFDADCTTKIVERLINYYAEYVEGDILSSKDKYNALFKECKLKDYMYLIYNSPFERHSIELYEMLLEVLPIEAMPEVLLNKIQKDQKYIKSIENIIARF